MIRYVRHMSTPARIPILPRNKLTEIKSNLKNIKNMHNENSYHYMYRALIDLKRINSIKKANYIKSDNDSEKN